MSYRYGCTCRLAVFMFVWVEKIVMSFTYVISFILLLDDLGLCGVYIKVLVRVLLHAERLLLLLLVLILCCYIVQTVCVPKCSLIETL